MINVLVTGGNGQLAQCIKDVAHLAADLHIIYTDYEDLDITDLNAVKTFFKNNLVDYCINCAAYTAVDKAESNPEMAHTVNTIGVENLARVCNSFKSTLIHISTDFVFDGVKSSMYTEQDAVNPESVYGKTKRDGEILIEHHLAAYFILRTSWLYSEHGNNFMKTMIKLSQEKEQLQVVVDQVGTPTYATDLAAVILQIVSSKTKQYGLYHYSNEGVASWYDFAKAIFEEIQSGIKLVPIKSVAYPTPAKRPAFSVLDKSKIKNILQIDIPYWRDSLRTALSKHHE